MITIPVILERCAGINVGNRGLAVAVAVGPADIEAEIKTRSYGTTVPVLQELDAWLQEEDCTSVAMESTGSSWTPVKNNLEQDSQNVGCARASTGRRKETRLISVMRWIWLFITVMGCQREAIYPSEGLWNFAI